MNRDENSGIDDRRDYRLEALLDDWEEARKTGHEFVSMQEMCRDCPDLEASFFSAVTRLSEMDHFLFPDRHVVDRECLPRETSSNSSRSLPLVPGYQVLSEIGRGGMGVVYRARQNSLQRTVAIKMLHRSETADPAYAARLRWEAVGLSMLDHPNIVKIVDVLETDDSSVAIVLEYIAGETLARQLKRTAMTPDQAAETALVLARTMSFVHEVGLLHRDIKPGNVLIDPAGRIRLVDFGLVKKMDASSPQTPLSFSGDERAPSHSIEKRTSDTQTRLTAMGEYYGTPSYMSPEQTPGGRGEVGVYSDVYSIGATLYEMLTGHPPFSGTSPGEIHRRVLEEQPVSPRQFNSKIPIDLETICLKCLNKEPADRFQNARQLAEELERFQQGMPIQSRPIGLLEVLKKWCYRRPAVAGLLTTLSLAACVIIGLMVKSHQFLVQHSQELEQLNQDLEGLVYQRDQSIKESEKSRQLAERRELQAKTAFYFQTINQAVTAFKRQDIRGLVKNLDRLIPGEGEADLRGFEWWHLYRRTHRPERRLLQAAAPQYLIEFAPDPQTIVVAGGDSAVRFMNRTTGKLEREIFTGQQEVNGVAFWPDRGEMATSGDDGTIRIWDLHTAHEKLNWKANTTKTFQIRYSHDGSQLIACGEDPEIRVFDVVTGELAFTLNGHEKTVQSIHRVADGNTLISVSNDWSARIWSLSDRRQISVIEHSANIGTQAFDPKRQVLFLGSTDGQLKSVNVATDEVLSTFLQADRIGALDLNDTHPILAVGDRSGQISLHRIDPVGKLETSESPSWLAHDKMIYSLKWADDGTTLISTGIDGRVVQWENAHLYVPEPRSFQIPQSSGDFALFPKTTSISIKVAGKLVSHDWMQNQTSDLLNHPHVTDPTFSADGTLLGVISTDRREIEVFHEARWPEILGYRFSQLPHAHAYISRLCFSPDSRSLAFSMQARPADGQPGARTIWQLTFSWTPPEIPTTPLQDVAFQAEQIPLEGVTCFKYSPAGKQLCLANQRLILWDLGQRRIVWEIANPSVRDIAYSPDGTLIAVACSNRQILVINASDGSMRFESNQHQAPVGAIAFSPDGLHLASGSLDGTVKLWQISTGDELLEWNNDAAAAIQLKYTDDGNQLVCRLQFSDSMQIPDRFVVYDGSPIILLKNGDWLR